MRKVLFLAIALLNFSYSFAQCSITNDPFTGISKKIATVFIGPMSISFSNSVTFEKVNDSLRITYAIVSPSANRDLKIENVRVHFKLSDGSIITLIPALKSSITYIEGVGVSQVIGVQSVLTEDMRNKLAAIPIEMIRLSFSEGANYDVIGLTDSKRKQIQKSASCIGE